MVSPFKCPANFSSNPTFLFLYCFLRHVVRVHTNIHRLLPTGSGSRQNQTSKFYQADRSDYGYSDACPLLLIPWPVPPGILYQHHVNAFIRIASSSDYLTAYFTQLSRAMRKVCQCGDVPTLRRATPATFLTVNQMTKWGRTTLTISTTLWG